MGLLRSLTKVNSRTTTERQPLNLSRVVFSIKVEQRKAATTLSPNHRSYPPSAASPLFEKVGLLVVFFVRLPQHKWKNFDGRPANFAVHGFAVK